MTTRIIHVSTSDKHGGAARAAYRLHMGLTKMGMDSVMFVQDKEGSDRDVHGANAKVGKLWVKIRPYIDRIPASLFGCDTRGNFSTAVVPGMAVKRIIGLDPDIVHLHWFAKGFIRIEAIRRIGSRPIIWTLHDSWAFTGGCHVPYSCTRYVESCGRCPILGAKVELDMSRWVWKRKLDAYRGLNLTIVTPSRWLGKCAQQSKIFCDTRVEVIPNGVDIQMYKPLSQEFSRDAISLPRDKKIVLFGAMYSTSDSNKGFDYLISALRKIAGTTQKENVLAVVIGDDAPDVDLDIGLDIRFLGHLHDDSSLALAYSAADVFVAPSIQENLPNMVMEAMACGIPSVAFNIGGMPDLIEHEITGYLAKPYEVEDLAQGILWVISDKKRNNRLSIASRHKIEVEYSDSHIAQRYASLYTQVLAQKEGSQISL